MTRALPVLDASPPPAAPPPPGPKETALRALWPVAVARLRRPRGWLSWARLARRYDLRFLHAHQLAVRIPEGLVPDCASCVDVCCTGENAVVGLRLLDVARLEDAGLARFVVHERPTGAAQEASWARREADASVFHRVFPVLARDRTGTCGLLTEDRLCGAYPAWPLSCARYPYALDLWNRSIFYAKGCASRELLPYADAAPKIRRLVDAVVQSYNERVKDVVLIHVARRELEEIGLARHLRLGELGR